MAHLRPTPSLRPQLGILLLAVSVGLYGQRPPDLPADLGGAAKLVTLTGQISILRDGNPWALSVGETVQPQQIIVTGEDGYGVFKVADGSTFEVFPKSRIVFRANRGDWRDLLEVWLGKVRVQIEHFGGLPNNNKVRTPTAVISVRGTIFDVEVEDTNNTTLVIDEEGQVVVRHLLRPSERVLNAGEWVRVYKDDPLAKQLIDKGGLLQRAARAASDAFYQAALNSSRAGSTIARGPVPNPGPGPGDKNTGGNAPPPPPPPPPAPPH